MMPYDTNTFKILYEISIQVKEIVSNTLKRKANDIKNKVIMCFYFISNLFYMAVAHLAFCNVLYTG